MEVCNLSEIGSLFVYQPLDFHFNCEPDMARDCGVPSKMNRKISNFAIPKRAIMSKTFNIYCDESTHLPNDGHPYMILGYVSIAANQIKMAKGQIKAIKARHGYTGELKWMNVHEATLPMYIELVEYFFMTDMQFRAAIVDKSQIDENRPDYTFNDFYFRMYYQLLHHKIDLENDYNVYIDIKDTCSNGKLHRLEEMLKWNTSIRRFQFVKSSESHFLQLADVIIGAINYNLRIEKGDIAGTVIAKRKIVEKIKAHNPFISLNRSSPLSNCKSNLFFISLK